MFAFNDKNWVLTLAVLNVIISQKVIDMGENQQNLYALANKIVSDLQKALIEIETVRLYYLIKENVRFQFDDEKGRIVVGVNKTQLTPSEFRELIARLARIKKVCKGFNNLLYVFQNQLSKSSSYERESALKELTNSLDTFMSYKRKTIVNALRAHGKYIDENFDIDSLESNVVTTKTSLLILRDIQNYYHKQLENIDTNLF